MHTGRVGALLISKKDDYIGTFCSHRGGRETSMQNKPDVHRKPEVSAHYECAVENMELFISSFPRCVPEPSRG